MYRKIRGKFNKVPWRWLICGNQGNPKWLFILYLEIQRRLYTKDRLKKWGVHTNLVCSLCNVKPETHYHLFFNCSVTKGMWQLILKWLAITRNNMQWNKEIKCSRMYASTKKNTRWTVQNGISSKCISYGRKRNCRMFREKRQSVDQILRKITQQIHCRCSMSPRLANSMTLFNTYP